MDLKIDHMKEQSINRNEQKKEWVSRCDKDSNPAVRLVVESVNGSLTRDDLYILGNKVSMKRAFEVWKFLTFLMIDRGIILVHKKIEIVRMFNT